jgi:hypothetical protein
MWLISRVVNGSTSPVSLQAVGSGCLVMSIVRLVRARFSPMNPPGRCSQSFAKGHSPPPESALRRHGQPWRLTREIGTFPAMVLEHWRFARASPWLPSAHLRAPPWPTAAPAAEVNPKAARRGGSSTFAALRDGHQRQWRRTSLPGLPAYFTAGDLCIGDRRKWRPWAF